MASKEVLVNIYDGKALFLERVTLKEAEELLTIPKETIRFAMLDGKRVMKKRFTAKKVGYRTIKKEKSDKEMVLLEWDEIVKPFRNVKWVKEGGRKLEFKHQHRQ